MLSFGLRTWGTADCNDAPDATSCGCQHAPALGSPCHSPTMPPGLRVASNHQEVSPDLACPAEPQGTRDRRRDAPALLNPRRRTTSQGGVDVAGGGALRGRPKVVPAAPRSQAGPVRPQSKTPPRRRADPRGPRRSKREESTLASHAHEVGGYLMAGVRSSVGGRISDGPVQSEHFYSELLSLD
jgi:hypothetical protein